MLETMPIRRHGLRGLIDLPFDDIFTPLRFRELFLPELKVEEYIEDGALVVKVEIPGIDPDKDVEISVTGDVLLVKAERTYEERKDVDGGFRSEFSYGSFERRIPLPEGAVTDDIKATYGDGILSVRMPLRTEQPTVTPIPVTRI